MIIFQQIFRSFGLALIGLMHPRMLWLGLRPFLIVSTFWGCLIWLSWGSALEFLSVFLTNSILTSWIQDSLVWAGFEDARAWIAPLFFVTLLIPLIAISLLIFIAFTTVPRIVNLLSRQGAYRELECKNSGGVLRSLLYAFWSILTCLALTIFTFPIWWIPPFVAILPPLLWGWLTMRLMSYDVLAKHASPEERLELLRIYRWPLLGMALATGMFGSVPTFFWATSALALVFFPLVSFFALWIYSLLFVFAGLWFAHFLLAALKQLRNENLEPSLQVDVLERYKEIPPNE
jgi:Etoposide-induced protein 2.4 (EI24)